MTDPQIPTPEAGDTSGDKSPSFSIGEQTPRKDGCVRRYPLTPGDEIPSQGLAFATRARAVTADVAQGPEAGAEPDRPVEEPRSRLPPWLRRRIEQDLPRIAEAYVPLPDPHFVPRILREAAAVTPPITPLQAPPAAASVTTAVTAAPVALSICPTCRCRVPARLSAAERQRAYRERKRKQR